MLDIKAYIKDLPEFTPDPREPQRRLPVVEEAMIMLQHGTHLGGVHHVLVAARSPRSDIIYFAGGTENHTTIKPHGMWTSDIAVYERLPPEECTLPHLRTEPGLEKKANGE